MTRVHPRAFGRTADRQTNSSGTTLAEAQFSTTIQTWNIRRLGFADARGINPRLLTSLGYRVLTFAAIASIVGVPEVTGDRIRATMRQNNLGERHELAVRQAGTPLSASRRRIRALRDHCGREANPDHRRGDFGRRYRQAS